MRILVLVFALLTSACCHASAARRARARHAEANWEVDFSTASFWLFVRRARGISGLIEEARFDFAVSVIPEQVWNAGAGSSGSPMEANKFRLFRFRNLPEAADADALRQVLARSGCRAANVLELLAFSLEYPEAQRWVRVVALNSHYGPQASTIQERYFYLGGDTRTRSLSLWEDAFGWQAAEYNWHFLVTCAN